jgi:nicotinamide riboside transporter PnuC
MTDGKPSRLTWAYWAGSPEDRADHASRPNLAGTISGWIAVAGAVLVILLAISLLADEKGLARPWRDLLVLVAAAVLGVIVGYVRLVRRRRRSR